MMSAVQEESVMRSLSDSALNPPKTTEWIAPRRAQASVATAADTFDAAAQKIVVASGEALIGWPLLGFAHVMTCNSGATPPLPTSSFLYTVTLHGQGAVAAVGYTPLPEPVRAKSRTLAASNNPSPSAAAGGAASPAPVVSDAPAVSDEPMASGSASPVTS